MTPQTTLHADLDTQPQSLSDLPSVDDALRAFRTHINEYRNVINDEGVWLFLSTLGCWGVGQPLCQLAAFGITVVLFGSRMSTRLKEKNAFPAITAQLHQRIHTEAADPEATKRRLSVLAQIKAVQLSRLHTIRSTGIFLSCWLFWGASFGYAIHQAISRAS